MVVDAADQRAASLTIDHFLRRAPLADQPAYRRLLQFASLPLVLTPELLNFLRMAFARETPWVAEVDILLSEDLCDVKGFEQYVLKTSIRAWLLHQARDELPEAQIRGAMTLLLHYLDRVVGSSISSGERATQAWSAMLYLDEHRDDAVRQIVGALQQAVTQTGLPGSPGAYDGRAELERLAELVQTLAPELQRYPALIEFSRLTSQVLRGEVDRDTIADASIWSAPTVAGVQLPTLASVIAPGVSPTDSESGPHEEVDASGNLVPRSEATQTTIEPEPGTPPESDPFEALFLSGGQPFVNRAVLRQSLRQMASGDGPRILIIHGPPGSGKTASGMVAHHVATLLGQPIVAVSAVRLSTAQLQPERIIRDVARQFGLDVRSIPTSESGDASRQYTLYQLIDWLVRQVNAIGSVCWLIFDDLDTGFLPEETEELIVELARAIHRELSPLRLILLGYLGDLPDEIESSVFREHIAPMSQRDVSDYIRHVVRTRGLNVSNEAIDEVVSLVLRERSPDQRLDRRDLSALVLPMIESLAAGQNPSA